MHQLEPKYQATTISKLFSSWYVGLAAKVLNQMILFIQKPDIENLHNGIEYIQLNQVPF